ncbi:MAG: hypothetical protein AB8G23_18950 [Myxococcota bacterium]
MQRNLHLQKVGIALLAGFLFVAVGAQSAFAAGTTAGQPILNSATVTYTVDTVLQDAIESSLAGNSTPGVGEGTPTRFTVDRKIDVQVSEVGTSVTMTSPNNSDQVLTFLVENQGNDAQDFVLTAVDGSGNTITFGSDTYTDDFNATNSQTIGIWLDDGDGIFNDTLDTETSYLDGFVVDTPTNVFVVRDIEATQANGSVSIITLNAQAVENSGTSAAPGAALTEDTGDTNVLEDAVGAEQIVFADDDGTATQGTDAARDGQHSASDAYLVESAQLTISKSATVIRDPFGNANPKSIPGSIVEYAITVTNGSGVGVQTATGITIADDLTSEMSGAAGGARLALVLAEYGTQLAGEDIEFETNEADGSTVVTDTVTAAADGDDGEFVSDALNFDNVSLDAGEFLTVRFRVEIQ